MPHRAGTVLGGDHALSIGSIAGAAAACERLGILWIDTHPDLNTPETSPSGNIHGMSMAVALGHGDRALATIAGAAPKVRPSDVTMIGLRDLDPGEEAFLARESVRVYPMAAIDGIGGFVAAPQQSATHAPNHRPVPPHQGGERVPIVVGEVPLQQRAVADGLFLPPPHAVHQLPHHDCRA